MEDEDIDMETVHDSQAFIHHHLNLLERPSTPGKRSEVTTTALLEYKTTSLKLNVVAHSYLHLPPYLPLR